MDTENSATVTTDAPAEPTTEPATTIDDTLNATFDAIEAREEGAEETQSTETAPEEVEADESTKEITDQPKEEEAEPEVATSAIDVPNSWSAEQQEKWAGIPPETQAYIAEREKQAHDQISRMGQELSAFKPVGDALQQHEQTFSRHGMTPIQGVTELLKVQDMIDNDPVGTLVKLAGQYNVDLSQLANGDSTQGDTSPQVAQLTQQVNQLTSRLSATEQHSEQQKQQEFQNEVTRAKEELAKSGIEQRPHYEALKQDIVDLLEGGKASSFAEAYEKAAWANPETRTTLLKEQQKADLDAKAKAAAEAKKAAKVNVGAKSKQTVSKPKNWEETLESAADAVFAS